ncbi:pyridoxal-dependent decarboxylase [uncultured Microscilla sp.]|uniref:pyridoxal phosphate-dependent decarboxylase family protein n=1 Tax=uncultured Microscilla sp. TaxID=432653 RepID=UPI00261830C2|nr:pyridoxal-dependent decarboxylase [uncultured Microscilla sp.]
MIEKAFNPEDFKATGYELIDTLSEYLATTQQNPDKLLVNDYQTPEKQREKWENYDFANGLSEYFKEFLRDSIHIHHPRYMGHQISTTAPIAALAAMMSDFLNNGMGIYEMGQSSVAMEHLVVQRLTQKMGFDDKAGGFLTSGGTLANLTALLAARRKQATANVWQEGNQQPLALMVSEQAHYCVERAVKIMGWGDAGIIKIPVDEQFCLRTDLLQSYYEQAIAQGKEVVAVVGSACSTATGSYDNLEAIADFCGQHNVWFHVDGAHGASAVFSDKHRHKVQGINRADSVVMDFHKTLLVPALATGLVFKDVNDSYNTFAQNAHYLWNDDEEQEWFNFAKRTFETTKFPMGFKIFTVWSYYGDALLEEMIDTIYDLGDTFAQLLQQHPSFELATPPACNIVCFRYTATQEDLSKINSLIRQQVLAEGKFYIVQALLNGETYLRVTLANPATTAQDLEDLLEHIVQIAQRQVPATKV